jgi:CHAD domain-containing protein
MSYRLDLATTVPEALRAALAERLEHAVGQLRDPGDDAVKAVHGARKDLKKARALLRLARPDLPKKAYAPENAALREVAHALSAAREADVLVDTMDALAERLVGQVPEPEIAALRERVGGLAAAARGDGDDAAGTGASQDALEQALERARVLPFDKCDDDTLRAGSVTAYARGHAAFATARRETTPENLHDWRKRVKDLWYHQRLLRDAWPAVFGAQADEADVLAKLLGDDHDLAELAVVLPDEPEVLAAIAVRRGEIQAEAWRVGRRLYAEKPKAFGRRLGRLLAAARAERGSMTIN